MSDYLIFGGISLLVALAALVALLVKWIRDKRLQQANNDLEITIMRLINEQLIMLEVEVADDMYLCYNHFTSDFVCQGRNIEEIIQRFHSRYPDKEAAIFRVDESAVETLLQQVKEFHENRNRIRSTP
jgi:hypothetical protein